MSSATSKCKLCGEEIVKTGNYSFKILPSKRVPKKANKLINGRNKQDDSLFRLTKFQKYLQRCSQKKNFIEIACGNCGESCKIIMTKPNQISKSSTALAKSTPTCIGAVNESVQSSRKRKNKSSTSKELNAGLTIPPFFSTPKLDTKKFQNRSLHHQKESFDTGLSAINMLKKHSLKDKKVIKSQVKITEQKEMSKLKTALFKSNEDLKKSGPSLRNFFS